MSDEELEQDDLDVNDEEDDEELAPADEGDADNSADDESTDSDRATPTDERFCAAPSQVSGHYNKAQYRRAGLCCIWRKEPANASWRATRAARPGCAPRHPAGHHAPRVCPRG